MKISITNTIDEITNIISVEFEEEELETAVKAIQSVDNAIRKNNVVDVDVNKFPQNFDLRFV